MKKTIIVLTMICIFLITIDFSLSGCGHQCKPNKTIVIEEATCKSTGIEKVYCECGELVAERNIPKNNHLFLYEVINNQTCTTGGERKGTCQNCGLVRRELSDELGHDIEWDVLLESTCFTEGMKVGKCSRCHDEIKEITPYKHRFSQSYGTATCATFGYIKNTCLDCDVVEFEKRDKIDHEWIDATCSSPKQCKNCEYYEGKPLSHIKDGCACINCGESLKHFGKRKCNRCGLVFFDEMKELILKKGTVREDNADLYTYEALSQKLDEKDIVVNWSYSKKADVIVIQISSTTPKKNSDKPESISIITMTIKREGNICEYSAIFIANLSDTQVALYSEGYTEGTTFVGNSNSIIDENSYMAYLNVEQYSPIPGDAYEAFMTRIANDIYYLILFSEKILIVNNQKYSMENLGFEKMGDFLICTHDNSKLVASASLCTSETIELYVCNRCEECYEKIDEAKGHDFYFVGMIKPATCQQMGEKNTICLTCGYTKRESIETRPHEMREIESDDGNKISKCIWCEKEVVEEKIP